MIQEFKDNETRTSGLIYRGTFNAIKELYQEDPVLAGELAISAIELTLTGDFSSNSSMVRIALAEAKDINAKNIEKYNNTIEAKRQKRIGDLRLDEIAQLVNQKYTQAQIGQRLGLSQQTVSKRLGVIRAEFRELLDTTKNEVVQEENSCTNKKEVVQDKSGCTTKNTPLQQKEVVQTENGCKNNKYNYFDF